MSDAVKIIEDRIQRARSQAEDDRQAVRRQANLEARQRHDAITEDIKRLQSDVVSRAPQSATPYAGATIGQYRKLLSRRKRAVWTVAPNDPRQRIAMDTEGCFWEFRYIDGVPFLERQVSLSSLSIQHVGYIRDGLRTVIEQLA